MRNRAAARFPSQSHSKGLSGIKPWFKAHYAGLPAALCATYAALISSVYLLAFGRGGYTDITLFKYVLFCSLTGLFVAAMLIFARGGRRLSATQYLVMLYWLFSAVSALLSEHRPEALTGMGRYEGLITITLYCAVFLLFSAFGKADWRPLWVLGVSTSLFCLICFLQFLGLNPFHLYPEGTNYYGMYRDYSGQFAGTIGNAGLVSAFLCVAAPLFWVTALRLKKPAALPPAALGLAVLVYIDVKAGLLGVLAGGLVSLPVVLPLPPKKRGVLALAVFAFFAAAAAAVYFCDFGGEARGGMLWEAHELLHGNFDDGFGTGRIYIWKNVAKLVPQRPLFGGGPDTLVYYMDAVFTRQAEDGAYIVKTIDAAHNEYLNILANQGALALLAYLAALACSFRKWLKSRSAAAAACGTAALCYCVQAFFGISQSISSIYFWIAWGLLEASSLSEEPGDGDARVPTPPPSACGGALRSFLRSLRSRAHSRRRPRSSPPDA